MADAVPFRHKPKPPATASTWFAGGKATIREKPCISPSGIRCRDCPAGCANPVRTVRMLQSSCPLRDQLASAGIPMWKAVNIRAQLTS